MKLTVKTLKVMSAIALTMGLVGDITSVPVFAQDGSVISLDDPNHVEGEKFRVVSVKVQYADGSVASDATVSILDRIDTVLATAKTDAQGILRFNGREQDTYIIRVVKNGEKVDTEYEVPRGDDLTREVVVKLKNKSVVPTNSPEANTDSVNETPTSEANTASVDETPTSEANTASVDETPTSEANTASVDETPTSEANTESIDETKSSEKSEDPNAKPDKPKVKKSEFQVVVYEKGTTKGVASLEFQVETEDGKVVAKGTTNSSGVIRFVAPVGKTYVIRGAFTGADKALVKVSEKITVPAEFDKEKSVLVFYSQKMNLTSETSTPKADESSVSTSETSAPKADESSVSTSETSAPKADESSVSTSEASVPKVVGSQVSETSSVKVTSKDNDETKQATKPSETKNEVKQAPKVTETKKEGKTLPKTGESTGMIALVAGVVTAILGGSLLLVGKKSKKKE